MVWDDGRHSVVNTKAIEDIVFKTSGDTVNVREPATKKIYSAKLIAQGDFNAHSHTPSFVSFRTCNLSNKPHVWLPDHAT